MVRPTFSGTKPSAEADPTMRGLILEEKAGQQRSIELIASENFPSSAVMECLNKYFEEQDGPEEQDSKPTPTLKAPEAHIVKEVRFKEEEKMPSPLRAVRPSLSQASWTAFEESFYCEAGWAEAAAKAAAFEDPKVCGAILGGILGAWCLGAGGALFGGALGCLSGLTVGIVLAAFTLGLSLPFGFCIGGGAGLTIGLVVGALTGWAIGTPLGWVLALLLPMVYNATVGVAVKIYRACTSAGSAVVSGRALKAALVKLRKGLRLAARYTRQDPSVFSFLACGIGGALTLGAAGALLGGAVGVIVGLAIGVVLAPFTLGISLPLGFSIGGGCGLFIGGAAGGLVGFVTGGPTGLLVGA